MPSRWPVKRETTVYWSANFYHEENKHRQHESGHRHLQSDADHHKRLTLPSRQDTSLQPLRDLHLYLLRDKSLDTAPGHLTHTRQPQRILSTHRAKPFALAVSQSSSPGNKLDPAEPNFQPRGYDVRTILLIILILLLLGALPTWPYSTGWGYYPSGGLGLVLLIVLILVLAKRI
jgi:Protein of unknown function (DUF3309)